VTTNSASGPDAPAIQAEGLTRQFGSVTAVAGIDLLVEPGEVFAFLGPNGAGKTTSIRMLVTLLRPTAGWARVAGFDVVAEADQVRRSIGVALQQVALDPLMTGAELLRLQGTLQGLDKGETRRRSGELLERMGLGAAADRRVGTYSGGMGRRLDLALALLHEPAVLFLDEPTAGLDPTSRVSLWEEIRRLNVERGMSVFLTTQYLEEADQLARRVAIIDGGRIVREGTPATLKAQMGSPVLLVAVADDMREAAEKVLDRCGERVPQRDRRLAVRLALGAGEVARVVRALDDAGIALEGMELTAPSLDDVFVAATGRRLEGSNEPEAGPSSIDPAR